MNQNNLVLFKKALTKEDKTEEKLAQKISTIIEGVLNQDISGVKNPEIKAPINRQRSKVVKEAIISAMVKKALEGELKAAQWLVDMLPEEKEAENS